MTVYQPGQRIRLVHTSDPYTDLRPGDLGVVRRHDTATGRVDIAWDSGSTLAMLLDSGDRITSADPTPTTPTRAPVEPAQAGDAPVVDAVTAAVLAAGEAAGRSAADWWCQHTVGGAATGDVRAVARRILIGVEDDDPAVVDTLPMFDISADTPVLDEVLAEHGRLPSLFATQRGAALDAYAEAYDDGAEDRVIEVCRQVASPTGADLTHLHPDWASIGAAGVFAGEWALTATADGDRYATGYVGVLVARWNGWAVFACARDVADAIVADHEQQRRELAGELRDGGVAADEIEQRVDGELARLSFDGDVFVADLRALQDDPEAIERVHPDRDGRYVVMGRIWCWEAVDPYDCERIVGDVPAPVHDDPHDADPTARTATGTTVA
jgi:hypothetical protein